ncbi:MAG: hypothetical protein NWF11_02645 [Candidatus Bathyarchaeota archaeon]|nr:hypothetical protein [Candidatus Bathyarchaeota archaeon]
MEDSLLTPVRRLEGITYWVIGDSEGIHDFINTEIRKEWEADAKFECRNPSEDLWLKTLSKRRWRLGITEISRIKLDPRIMNFVDNERGYNFGEELAQRSEELQKSIREYSTVIWPVIVKEKDFQLVDSYCRYGALKTMNIKRIYAYTGTL